jgi:hypothetical protein
MEKEFEPKSGMLFETKDGTRGFWIETEKGLVTYWVRNGRISTYAGPNNFRYAFNGADPEVKFYNPRYEGMLIDWVGGGLVSERQIAKPVWTKEPKITEMTLKEVAEKLGIPVEQLRIKDED